MVVYQRVIGLSLVNHPYKWIFLWGTPIYGTPQISYNPSPAMLVLSHLLRPFFIFPDWGMDECLVNGWTCLATSGGKYYIVIPSGKQPHSYGNSPSLQGKSTINGSFSIAMLVYQRKIWVISRWNVGSVDLLRWTNARLEDNSQMGLFGGPVNRNSIVLTYSRRSSRPRKLERAHEVSFAYPGPSWS